MKLAIASNSLGLVTLVLITSNIAMADDLGWYGGINIGQSIYGSNGMRITDGLLGSGVTRTHVSDDNHDLGYKAFGGYQFNNYFALEGGYFNLGKYSFATRTIPTGILDSKIKVQGVSLDAVGFVPITDKFSAFGRVGVNYADAKDSFIGTGSDSVLDSTPSQRNTNYKYGLGVQYDITDSIGIRAEVERYRINDAPGYKDNIDFISIGLLYRFGGNKPAFAPEASMPPTSAPIVMVAEAPALVIVPAPARTEQYCSILDLQFEINRADIQREDMEKLSVVGTFMNKYPNTTAAIEGHTDNVGTPEDNMKLSQQRAESVVNYLEESFNIAPSRLTAVGYGDTRPLADNSTEEGKRANRRIDAVIACATDIAGLTVAPARITMAMVIDFDRNQSNIGQQYRDGLQRVANFLKANPSVTATVEGNTANLQASPELAIEISQRRAQNVVDYLADTLGIDRSRLSVEGFGQTHRFAYNTSLEGQQENRRVNIIINYPQ